MERGLKIQGFQELIELVDDFSKNHSAIRGYVDVIENHGVMQLKDTDCFYVMFGPSNDELIKDILSEYTPEVEKPGVYEFDAIIYVDHGGWNEPSEYYVDWSNWKFIQTIESRDREIKLNELLDIDFLK